MKNTLRSLAAAGALVLMATSGALAEWKPSGPITMLIGFAAGGGADTQARMIAEELERRHGWQIIPEQATGGGGAKLSAKIKDMPNDGTVIGLAVTETYGYNMLANPKAGYTQADITPLTTTAGFQMGIVSQTSKGWNDFGDVIAAAKAGETIRFGTMSPRIADIAFLLGEANGVEFNIIEVKGGKAVMNGVNAGDMDVGFMAGIQAKGVAAGDLVNLASALSTPLKMSPDAKGMDAYGVDFVLDGYFVFVGPGGMPSDAQKAISTAIAEIVNAPSTKAGGFIKKAFGGPATISGSELGGLLAADAADAEKLMMAVN